MANQNTPNHGFNLVSPYTKTLFNLSAMQARKANNLTSFNKIEALKNSSQSNLTSDQLREKSSNQTLNSQINNLARTFLLNKSQVLAGLPAPREKTASRAAGGNYYTIQFPQEGRANKLSSSKSINLDISGQRKYDLFISSKQDLGKAEAAYSKSEKQARFGKADTTFLEQSLNKISNQTPNFTGETNRINRSPKSFLAYWLLPFLGLIPTSLGATGVTNPKMFQNNTVDVAPNYAVREAGLVKSLSPEVAPDNLNLSTISNHKDLVRFYLAQFETSKKESKSKVTLEESKVLFIKKETNSAQNGSPKLKLEALEKQKDLKKTKFKITKNAYTLGSNIRLLEDYSFDKTSKLKVRPQVELQTTAQSFDLFTKGNSLKSTFRGAGEFTSISNLNYLPHSVGLRSSYNNMASTRQSALSISGTSQQVNLSNSASGNTGGTGLGLTFANYLKYLKYKLSSAVGSAGQKTFINYASESSKQKQTSSQGFKTSADYLVQTANLSLADIYKQLSEKAGSTQLEKPEIKLTMREVGSSQNAMSVVLNHKKFNTVLKDVLGEKSAEELAYIIKKKDIQRKHKAKKQRLESRRQKKRKRFYPRPTWLRLRLGLSMSDRRSTIDTLRQVNSKQRATTKGGSSSGLQRYLVSRIQSASTSPALNLRSAGSSNQKSKFKSAYSATLNSTTYNQIVYNLIFSKNLINSRMATDNTTQSTLRGGLSSSENVQTQLNKASSSQNVSMYKSENKALSEFLYKKQPPGNVAGTSLNSSSRVQIQKLIQIKNNLGGAVVNFERKSNNQTTPPKETNSNMLRDFWVWLYDTTSRNTYNKTLLVDTVLNHLSVPINLTKETSNYRRASEYLVGNSASNQKALKLSAWAYNQTNLLSSTNKRLNIWGTQKLRNQSKNNKTKFIEKQLKKQLRSAGGAELILKNLSSRSTTVGSSKTTNFGKLASRITNKMHQKELKLAFITNLEQSNKMGDKSKEAFTNIIPFTKSQYLQQDATPHVSSNVSRVNPINTKYFDNLNWWRWFNTTSLDLLPANSANTNIALSTSQRNVMAPIISGALFHFCALISLISISQLRCFIKFHLILLHKLSNGYLQVLFKTSSFVQKYLSTSFMSLSLFLSKSSPAVNTKTKVQQAVSNRARSALTSRGAEMSLASQVMRGVGLKLNRKRRVNTKTLIGTLVEKGSTIGANLGFSHSSNLNNMTVARGSKFNNSTLLSTISAIRSEKKATSLKSTVGSGTMTVLLDKAFSRSGLYGNATVTSLNTASQNEYNALVRKNLQILQMAKQLELSQFTKETVHSVKKETLNAGFKVVDTFESILRIIYGIFEKPYEFTMDWIAYAFLVEWSSDILAYTPQNNSAGGAQAKNWSTFAKVANQNQLNLIFLGLASSSVSNSLLRNPTGMQAFSGLSTVALSQFLTKRILYLNDLFLTVLYRPDTDLIVRQRKGTLFWDIWSDFLLKAADKYNINVPSLSNIKEEQNVLLENFLSDPTLVNPKASNSNKVGITPKNWLDKMPFRGAEAKKGINNPALWAFSQLNLSNKDTLKNKTVDKGLVGYSNSLDYMNLAQQSVTYQSKETDLFLEYHPPKSFSHISAIKYYSMVQQPIGSLVCQIYSGILEKQIAKNVLVIGSTLSSNSASSGSAAGFESMQKTLLIQALAGETEMKIITDNASRYAVVSRGFAVGIKYLKEVFEAITLNTPCLFLLEDIHLIGERRPQLISDHGDAFGSADGMSKATDANFGAQRSGETVHEKNQISYQLSRHSITHYKKPFKGDFSLAIPSNHFAFDFFLKSSSNSPGTAGFANFSEFVTHPLASSTTGGSSIFESESGGDSSGMSKTDSTSNLMFMNKKLSSKRKLIAVDADSAGTIGSSKTVLSSSVLLNSSQNVRSAAPPSTSPFSVLLLKEQKKLKAKKIVKELPWIGFSSGAGGAQQNLLPRVSYSVRAKVSALAELGFSSMSAKLDMITDLLVIIDSVRGHRGFVVFATTHLPHILDPALRRPGRLDETISIPTLSNLWTRWEFSKTSFNPMLGNTQSSLNNTTGVFANNMLRYKGTLDATDFINLDILVQPNALKGVVPTLVAASANYKKQNTNLIPVGDIAAPKNKQKYMSKVRHVAYYQMGKKLFTTKYAFNLSSFSPVYLNPTTYESVNTLTETSDFMLHYGPEALKYKSLYMSPKNGLGQAGVRGAGTQVFGVNNVLVTLMGGKFTEFFASSTVPAKLFKDSTSGATIPSSSYKVMPSPEFTKHPFKSSFMSLYGIDQTWRAATAFTLSFVQKRYLFNKNLIVPKLLSFLNYAPLEEAPSPPASNILVPAKRFENAKKGFKETIQYKLYGMSTLALQDKLDAHTKQAYIRNLFKAKETASSNTSSSIRGAATNMTDLSTSAKLATNALLQVNSGDGLARSAKLLVPTSASWLYQKKILNRHKIALNNQWWNGLLTEHTAETLVLSDIDWRYTFIQDFNNPDLYAKQQQFFAKLRNQGNTTGKSTNLDLRNVPTLKSAQSQLNKDGGSSILDPHIYLKDVVIDFPDADQYYNPKQRRWFVTSGYWNSWFNMNQDLQTEMFEYLIFESIINSFNILNNNRELLDYAASKFIKTGLIKETNYKILLTKFNSDTDS